MENITSSLTPKELMISRYEAFVREDWEYIAKTSVHQSVEELSSSKPVKWLKLDVLDSDGDFVEFKAYYRENTHMYVLHEKSRFIKENGIWKYLDGEHFNSKIERNESCPCGSGKKFKKCCS